MSHDLTISGNTTFSGTVSGPTPTLDSHLATKGYVDNQVGPKLSWNVAGTKNINFTISSSSSSDYYQVSSPSIPTSATVVKIYLYAHSSSSAFGVCCIGSDVSGYVDIPSSGSGKYFGLLRYDSSFLTGDAALVDSDLLFADSRRNTRFSGYATWYYI